MDFNEVVKDKVLTILCMYGFRIVEESRNRMLFQSSFMKVNIAFNNYENSYLLEIGKKGEILYPLNNDFVNHVLNLNLSIEKIDLNSFIRNIILLFESKTGADLLKGNISKLECYIEEKSKKYTSKTIRDQILTISLNAWKVKDYMKFIENIDKIGVDKVPESYQLKYRIAKRETKK